MWCFISNRTTPMTFTPSSAMPRCPQTWRANAYMCRSQAEIGLAWRRSSRISSPALSGDMDIGVLLRERGKKEGGISRMPPTVYRYTQRLTGSDGLDRVCDDHAPLRSHGQAAEQAVETCCALVRADDVLRDASHRHVVVAMPR